MNRTVQIATILVALSVSCGALELEFRNDANRKLQKRLSGAAAGDVIAVAPGVYIGGLRVPEGVSMRGEDVDKCRILGTVVVDKPADQSGKRMKTVLQYLTFFHLGGRSTSLLRLDGVRVDIRNCLISSNGGFAAILANDKADVSVKNSIIVGPLGDYAIFSRRGGKLSITNCTLVCRGFGVGLMDKSKATIRDCLFMGSHKVAVIRTDADYTISHCNFSLGKGSVTFDHELINGNVPTPGAPKFTEDPAPKQRSNRDEAKYDGQGLTFKQHRAPTVLSVSAFRKNEPKFAADGGSSRGLGAFRGKTPGWK